MSDVPNIIDLNVEDVKPAEPVEEGEYTVTIKTAEVMRSKKNRLMVRLIFDTDNPEADSIFHYLMMVEEGDAPNTKKLFERNIAAFLDAFELPRAGQLDVTEWIGLTAQAFVIVDESEEHGTSNKIKRFLLPAG